MKKYSIIYSDGYWELHDGTMIGNGDPFPLLTHIDKAEISLYFKTAIIKPNEEFKLDIYDRYGRLENSIYVENVGRDRQISRRIQ
jgi:hypothetical protein